MAEISLTQGYVTIVDDEDADLGNVKWHAFIDRSNVYAKRWSEIRHPKRQLLLLHRVVLERVIGRPIEQGEVTDHIDGNGLNNRRCNLRLATLSENARNSKRRRDNSSGLKGVYHKTGRGKKNWVAHIRINGKQKVIGRFYTPEEAHEAYKTTARELYGDYARME